MTTSATDQGETKMKKNATFIQMLETLELIAKRIELGRTAGMEKVELSVSGIVANAIIEAVKSGNEQIKQEVAA